MRKLFHFLIIFVILFSGCSGLGKKYTIAIDPSFYPANLGGQADAVYGFTVDLLKEIAAVEAVKISYITAGSESLLNALQRFSFDAVITPKVNLGYETNIYTTSKNYFETGPVLVTPMNSNLDKLSQMQSKIVGVVAQSDAYFIAQQNAKTVIYSYQSPADALEALKYDLIDSAFLDVMVARAYVNNLYEGLLKIASDPIGDEGLYLVTMVGYNSRLVDAFNRGLKVVKHRGTYKKLMEKWNLSA